MTKVLNAARKLAEEEALKTCSKRTAATQLSKKRVQTTPSREKQESIGHKRKSNTLSKGVEMTKANQKLTAFFKPSKARK